MTIDNRISALQFLESRKDEVIPALQILIKIYDNIEYIQNTKSYIQEVITHTTQIYRKSYVKLLEYNASEETKYESKEEFEGVLEVLNEELQNSSSIINQNIPSMSLDTTDMNKFMSSLNEGHIEILAYAAKLQNIKKILSKIIKNFVSAMHDNITYASDDTFMDEKQFIQYLNSE
jgi:hypothetical protein